MTFTSLELDQKLLAQVQRQGYTAPTPIQTAAIPAILSGRDVIGLAQTGTGKTAAFVLPLLQQLLQGQRGGIRALIVTPTRELAEQIHTAVVAFSHGTGLRSATVYGGVSMLSQERALRSGANIIVACPGRLLDHMDRGYVRFDRLQLLVLDEADRMLDMGFLPSIKRILARLPTRRQTLLFSATMPTEMQALTSRTTHDALTVQVDASLPPTTVSHALYPVVETQKTAVLLELLHSTTTASVLVFTRTKHRANKVAAHLEQAGYRAARLHGNRSQNQRQIALDGFRNGTFQVLVATDIAARGIDVNGISHVINYDMPDTIEAYIHRIGRTGRATRSGDAFTLVTSADQPLIRAIERTIGHPLERRTLSGLAAQELVQPPTVNRRPPTANRRPPTTERQRPATDRRVPSRGAARRSAQRGNRPSSRSA